MKQNFTLGKEEKQRITREMANILRTCRTLCGWSQEQLADLVGVTRQTVLAVENAKRDMTWTMYLAFLFLFLGNARTKKELLSSGAYTAEVAEYLSLSMPKK